MSENREKPPAEFNKMEVEHTEQAVKIEQPAEGSLEVGELCNPEKDDKKLEEVRKTLKGKEGGAESNKQLGLSIAEEDEEFLEKEIKKLKHETKFQSPALLSGNKTATKYDSKVRNFSTQTKIVELPSGRKLFLINNYNTSWVHRGLDNTMKYFTGCKMSKAKSSE